MEDDAEAGLVIGFVAELGEMDEAADMVKFAHVEEAVEGAESVVEHVDNHVRADKFGSVMEPQDEAAGMC